MGTGSIKPCNMSKNLLQWGFSAAFPTLRKRVSRNAEEDLSCKGNISRIRQAGRSWLRQWAWVHFSTVLQNLCNFLLVPLVQVISQTNRPSLFSDTFNHQARLKVQKCPRVQLKNWGPGGPQHLRAKTGSKCSAKSGRVNLHHSHPLLTFMRLVGLTFLLLFVWFYVFPPPKTENQIASENRCQEQMFPDAVDII